jgi:hypothetical protein
LQVAAVAVVVMVAVAVRVGTDHLCLGKILVEVLLPNRH